MLGTIDSLDVAYGEDSLDVAYGEDSLDVEMRIVKIGDLHTNLMELETGNSEDQHAQDWGEPCVV